MFLKTIRVALVLAVGGFVSVSAAFAEQTASEAVQSTVHQVKAAVASGRNTLSPEQLDAKLKDIIAPVFDFDEMAKRSLGANWNTATPEQQNEYVQLFSDLLARNYLKKIRENVETGQFSLVGENQHGGGTLVKTSFTTNRDTVAIDYRLYQKDGRWRAYDVVIENIGLVSNYRSEFAGIIRKEKVEGLLKRLREKKVGAPA